MLTQVAVTQTPRLNSLQVVLAQVVLPQPMLAPLPAEAIQRGSTRMTAKWLMEARSRPSHPNSATTRVSPGVLSPGVRG
ncbi:MAG TPA: hypothetical protein VNY82_12555 [Steroidobacteraceae bacterium]|nr:hypothetical protein [Steroidobacteraceae bacterium]